MSVNLPHCGSADPPIQICCPVVGRVAIQVANHKLADCEVLGQVDKLGSYKPANCKALSGSCTNTQLHRMETIDHVLSQRPARGPVPHPPQAGHLVKWCISAYPPNLTGLGIFAGLAVMVAFEGLAVLDALPQRAVMTASIRGCTTDRVESTQHLARIRTGFGNSHFPYYRDYGAESP